MKWGKVGHFGEFILREGKCGEVSLDTEEHSGILHRGGHLNDSQLRKRDLNYVSRGI
jgi:hypothetical protein